MSETPYVTPHPEGAPTISRGVAIIGMVALVISEAVFALLFLLELIALRDMNLYALFVTYIIIPTVAFLVAVIALFLDYHFRTLDVFEKQSIYFAMLVYPRYVWAVTTWIIITMLAILVTVLKVSAFWMYAVGTSINPPYNVPALAANPENMRYFNMTFEVVVYSIIVVILTIKMLHIYGLKTEQPISAVDVRRWISKLGGDPDLVIKMTANTSDIDKTS